EHRTPLLYGTDYEGGCCSRYLFCYSPIPDHYVQPLIPYLTEDYGKTFYLLGANYVWPIKMSAAIKAELQRSGGSVVGEEYLALEVKDFDDHLERIARSGATIVVMMLSGLAGQIFIRRFSELGLPGKVKLVVPAFNENYLSGLEKREAEGIVTCNPFLANLNRPEARDFVGRQKKMFGPDTVVSYFVESHYGLILFLKNAIEKAKTDDKEEVIDAMGDQTLVVGNGPVTLRASDHHMVLNMLIAEVKAGDLVMTKYIGPVAPADQCAGKKKA
ncbi:MAG: ABC transporter substrate-binding protein, partial [Deltaproteobacteria bacterium]